MLWGQALNYLRDYERLATAEQQLRLAVLASFYQHDDYALKIVDQLQHSFSAAEQVLATALSGRLRRDVKGA